MDFNPNGTRSDLVYAYLLLGRDFKRCPPASDHGGQHRLWPGSI